MFDTFLFVESFNLNVSLGNFISLISSFPQAWNISFFFFCCWELVEVTTLSPSMINTIPSVEEWDIKINSVKKEV